jgi:hypothetical protein
VEPAPHQAKSDFVPEGHTSTRCKAEKPETIDAEDGGFNDASVVPASNDAPTGEVGDWNVQEESAAAW